LSYAVKEIFYSLQGEGANSGRAAVFCRFAGCNLWTGREEDRAGAVCQFCDTDFVGTHGPDGGKFTTAETLASAIAARWPQAIQRADSGIELHAAKAAVLQRPLVIFTGGEPLLQLDGALVGAMHDAGFEVAVETNGTIVAPHGIDWICVSPKAGAALKQRSGSELKLVYPQAALPPDELEHLQFDHFFLQPMDGPERDRNTASALQYCLEHPRWRLSLQTHKLLGIR